MNLAIIITLCIILLALITYTILMGIQNHYVVKLFGTIEFAYNKGISMGLKGVELKAYVIQAVEDKMDELHIPLKIIRYLIKMIIKRIIEYKEESR